MAIEKLELAKDVLGAIKKAGLTEKFSQLPLSHRREYLKWIEDAKKTYTRSSRIAKMLNMLSNDNR